MRSYVSLNLQSQAIANVLASDDATFEFFQEELKVLPRPQDSDLVSVATTATYKTARGSISGFSIGRTFRGVSTDSVDLNGTRLFTLEELCEFIRIHPSLQTAGIVSCSCYTEPTIIRFIPHRFLVLELHREGRQNIWLRLDRRRAADVGIVGLSVASGVTPSNDMATLASTRKKLLTGRPVEESRLTFTSPGRLSSLRFRLIAITAVMDKYKLTSENCWAFCSFLLSFFRTYDQATFKFGKLRYPKIAQSAMHQISRHLLPSILSPHDPSLYVPFSILLHDIDTTRGKKVAEAARHWEDSDGFNSSEGQVLAGLLISSSWNLELHDSFIFQKPDSQLALQTTALCLQVAACAGALWPTLGSDVCSDSVFLLRRHGVAYLESKPPNPNAALPLFEEATSLFVPGVTRNYEVCWFRYYQAIALHALGQLDEARVVVMDFIECVRHRPVHLWHDQMKELRSRGIWPSQFNYLFDLKHGDLPHWAIYWREDQSKSQPTLPFPPSESPPSTNPLPSSFPDISGSLPPTSPAAEDFEHSLPASLPRDDINASAINSEDLESDDGDAGAEHGGSHTQEEDGADEWRFSIEVV